MPRTKKGEKRANSTGTTATIGYEARLWQMADGFSGSADASSSAVVTGKIDVRLPAEVSAQTEEKAP
ncbi:MAG: hypothetical protein AB1543_02765 [Candidatus Bipolaricaulota bacterium]